MNIDYFLLHPAAADPTRSRTSSRTAWGCPSSSRAPGCSFASRADWRDLGSWWLLGAAIAVLIPTLLYYGGGWLQYGYRYFLDSVPFVIALCGLAAVRRGRVGLGWRILIGFGVVVMGVGVYWAYNLR